MMAMMIWIRKSGGKEETDSCSVTSLCISNREMNFSVEFYNRILMESFSQKKQNDFVDINTIFSRIKENTSRDIIVFAISQSQ